MATVANKTSVVERVLNLDTCPYKIGTDNLVGSTLKATRIGEKAVKETAD